MFLNYRHHVDCARDDGGPGAVHEEPAVDAAVAPEPRVAHHPGGQRIHREVGDVDAVARASEPRVTPADKTIRRSAHCQVQSETESGGLTPHTRLATRSKQHKA